MSLGWTGMFPLNRVRIMDARLYLKKWSLDIWIQTEWNLQMISGLGLNLYGLIIIPFSIHWTWS